MSLFIVCFDLKDAEPVEYDIWKKAFTELYKNNCKKIERTTWLVRTNGGAVNVYRKILRYVKGGLVAKDVKELQDLDNDLLEMIDNYLTMDSNELELTWLIENRKLDKVENNVDDYLENMKIFIGEIADSEDNVTGCLGKNDWASQPASLGFNRYFKNKNGKCKIRLL